MYDYFAGGSRAGTAPRCGTCDVCLGWHQREGRVLDDDELLRVRIALSAVGRLSGRFGVERVAQVLTGSRAREVLDRRLDQIPTYGKLAAVPIDEVKELLNALADAGLLERRGIEGGRPGAFVLSLSAEGRAVAKGESRPVLALPPGRDTAPRRSPSRPRSARGAEEDAPACDAELLARLKAWRSEEAQRRGLPPYVVFHDRTLEAVAAALPRDRESLARVKGVGPAKLEAYGETLLRLLG